MAIRKKFDLSKLWGLDVANTTAQADRWLVAPKLAPVPNNVQSDKQSSQNMFANKFANQWVQPEPVVNTPAAAVNTPAPSPSVQWASGFTKQPDVVIQDPNKREFWKVDYSTIDAMDISWVKRYVNEVRARASQGQEVTYEEQVLLGEANNRIQADIQAQQVADPYEPRIAAEEKARDIESARLQAQSNTLINSEEARINAIYQQRTTQAEEQWARAAQSAARSMSFSGLGRSTFNADQQVRIQEQTNQNMAILQEEKFLAVELYRAKLAWADSKALESYQTRINTLRDDSAKFMADQAVDINSFNQQNNASYEEKINNIMAYAQTYVDPNNPLSEAEMAEAGSYAELLIDSDGWINNEILKSIDPRLMGEAIKLAAEIKWAIPEQGNYQFINSGNGLVAVADENTWEIRYEQGNVQTTREEDLSNENQDLVNQGLRNELWLWEDTGDLTDDQYYKAIVSGKLNWKKFFGLYATADPDWTQFISIYNTAKNDWLEWFISKYKGTSITADMVTQAGNQFGVDPLALAAKMAQDSSMGTKWKGARNNNPWNVWQFDSLDAQGITVEWYKTLQEWVDAVASNFASRAKAMKPLIPNKESWSEKETYLNLVKRWWLTKSDQMEIADLAIDWWWSTEFNEALKQWFNVELSPTQQTQYNKELDRFQWNAVVKWFEGWLTSFQSLWFALSEGSWPWDMAGIFTFVKTLDPTSVVREAEYEAAAKSAWVWARLSNTFDRLTKGKSLTENQAEDFKKIAQVYIEQKAQSYDRLYTDMTSRYSKFGIDPSLAPLSATEQLRNYLGWTKTNAANSVANPNAVTWEQATQQENDLINSLF